MGKIKLGMLAIGMAVSALGIGQMTAAAAENNHTVKTMEAVSMEEVTLSAGTLVGYKDGEVYHFKGIPYATAERFQDPVPVKEYESGYRMALSYGPVAPQGRTLSSTATPNVTELLTPSNGTADMVGNEICQYLNVWTSDLEAKKPVVVFFHGGAMSTGASSELSSYEGQYFAETQDTVFVSVNHRLNVLGFLDLSKYGKEYDNSGIAGLRDCVCALQWVQDNIEAFGGDPKNVTVVGQSGGGHKVTTLACMSDTVGLFDKVVSMSGYYSFSDKADGLSNTEKLVDYLGLKEDEVVSTLEKMSYEELYQVSTEAGCTWDNARYGNSTFEVPLFDEDGKMNEYAAGRKWLIGTAYGDGGGSNGIVLAMTNSPSKKLDILDEEKAMEELQELYGDNAEKIAKSYKEAYPEHPLAEALFISTGTGILSRGELISEESGTLKQFNDAGVDVYNYVSGYTLPLFGGITMYHSGDLPFWLNSLDEAPYLVAGDEENAYQIAEDMSATLAAFAATGDPSTENIAWESYSTDAHNTMVFDVKSECKTDFDTELYKLLNAN